MVEQTNHTATSLSRQNAAALISEIGWLEKVITTRLRRYAGLPAEYENILHITPPDRTDDTSVLGEFTRFYHLQFSERLVLLLALLPHIAPQVLGNIIRSAEVEVDVSVELGGVKNAQFRGFLPTGETALFLLAGNNLSLRFQVQTLFDTEHLFRQHNILSLAPVPAGEPFYSGQLLLNEEYIDFFTTGKLRRPLFSTDFPARCITTQMTWSDLVLDSYTATQLAEIKIWLQHGAALYNGWEMGKRIKPGYKVLFYGPPGTGKTLAAGLLGKEAAVDVYRVDLSMVISKYIGETEKNLEKVFSKAEHKNWILFFDEADALFGKRTSVSDAHDRYANQEIAYLLQRLEDYNGLVILSSNMRGNVDEAFGRRLQSVVHFPMPKATQRLRLWQLSFSEKSSLAADVDLSLLAEKFELAGGSIINVVQYASLMALNRGDNTIYRTDLLEGIRKEYIKEGKTA